MDENPFKALKSQWLVMAKRAKDHKKDFQADADECMRYFDGPYLWLYGLQKQGESVVPGGGSFVFTSATEGMPKPSTVMTYNRIAEGIQLFGPSLYHRNPVRKVNPLEQPIVPMNALGNPQDQNIQAQYAMFGQMVAQQRSQSGARALLLEFYQNYTPNATGVKDEIRLAIDEALIKGMGTTWAIMYKPTGSRMRMATQEYDTVDNLLIDPDCEQMRDAKYIMRRRVKPIWEVCAEFGLDPKEVKGNAESQNRQAIMDAEGGVSDWYRQKGTACDLLVYFEIYSKMGMGTLLKGVDWHEDTKALDRFGQYIKIVVAEGVDYPLNLPQETWADEEEMGRRVQWETPFWADDTWPMTPLIFHTIPRKIWPMPHFKPALGELAFLNWAYSFVASKIKKACRDLIACKMAAGEEIQRAIISGNDYELIKLTQAQGNVNDIVQFLQHPPFQGDIWTVITAVERNFERRVGLPELMYGEQETQDRSATVTEAKVSNMQIRPNDMVNKVEDFATEHSRKEALMARWHHEPEELVPLLGRVGAHFWGQFVTPADPSEILHQLEYRIEAGSTRKPNPARDLANASMVMQNVFAPLLQVGMQTGQVGPVNAVLEMWAKANDMDPTKFMLQPPPPPQPGPSPEEQESQQKMAHEEDEHRMGLRHAAEKHAVDMRIAKEKAALNGARR